MSVMLSILSSFLLVMVAGGGLRTSLVSAEETIVSNSGRVIAYWQTMLPNTPMPSAIQDLLTPTAGNDDHITKPATNSISTTEKGTHEKFTGVPFHKARKLRPHIKKFQNLENGHEGDVHIHGDFTFTEDIVKLGSTIIPYILPSATLGAPLLQRDIADYIPISIRNFNGIMKMFAPVSYSMANDIWSTLNMCEHVRPLKGEKKMCIGSVESMVEFVSSVLGSTRDLRAFSSSQVPNEGVVTKRRYKVVASRRPTESSETATCHGMNFPYAVFMCHAMNPTRVYALTLQSENDGGEGQKMEVLVVCHLDTSGFDPSKMPKGTRPGEAPACHFVGRDTVLWAPVAAAATTTAA
ncbi:hypothetical protein ACQJBY_072114 [Aegilops geniculata]